MLRCILKDPVNNSIICGYFYALKITYVYFQVNHDFRKNNSVYVPLEHPRWGAIMGVLTTTYVKAGTEILTYYGYDRSLAFPDDFLDYL